MDGLVLRYGMFYGPGTHFDGGQIADDVRKRRFPIVGKGTACSRSSTSTTRRRRRSRRWSAG